MGYRILVSAFLLQLNAILLTNGQLEEYFKWKQITFTNTENGDGKGSDHVLFPERTNYGNNFVGSSNHLNYNASNSVPMGATHYKDRIFVTVPRRRTGVPSTLNTINVNAPKGSSPSFEPFPNQNTNNLHPSLRADPNRIISVYRTRVDSCDRLWFIDTGLLEYPNNATQVQRPSIWVYDLERNTLIRRFEIPENIVQRGNGLASITVDVKSENCNAAFGYIPDLANYRLHVYSLQQNRIWSFSHNYFSFDPLWGDFNVADLQYQWNDGIFSITLGFLGPDGYRIAYFHPMASIAEFAVSTRVLQSESLANRSYHGSDFVYLGMSGPITQSAMHDFDRSTGVIFFSQVASNAISCWNTATPFTPANHVILAKNDVTMIYPADLNIDQDGYVWVFTNTMPRFIYSRLNPDEFNFRIWRGAANELINGTACANNLQTNPFWGQFSRY